GWDSVRPEHSLRRFRGISSTEPSACSGGISVIGIWLRWQLRLRLRQSLSNVIPLRCISVTLQYMMD
ncbi:mfs, partial [Moniliophthora roreri]